MPDAKVVEGIRLKYYALVGDLDERGRRRWAATEAIALGRGGIVAVAAATGLSDRTVKNGIAELRDANPLSAGRQRRPERWSQNSGVSHQRFTTGGRTTRRANRAL